jgi:exopolysaccharide transport family protein
MGSNESNRDVDIDLASLGVAVWQRKGRIALITLLAGVAAFAASSVIAPRYKGEARLLIESRAAAFSTAEQNRSNDEPLLDALNIVSQSQIIQSVDLIKQVSQELRLYELPEFDPAAKPSLLSHFLIGVGLKRNPLEVPPNERVLEAFREKLMVYQVENSRVIAVEFTSEDPKLAALVPNTILQTYLAMQSGAKLGTDAEAAKWLEPEIGALRERVREADRKVADFRNSADLTSVGEGATFASRQLIDISAELARLRTEKATADARAENVRQALAAGRPIDNFADVVGSAMIQRLKESESEIQGQISDLSTSLLEGHPRLRGLRAQLSGIRRQIDEEARKIVSTLENEARVADIREGELSRQLAELKDNSARAGEQEVSLNELEREAAAQRQLLETYLARYREATSRVNSQDSTPADARVISSAVEPRDAYFPKTGANVIVAALAALIFSSIVIMLIELFSGRALRPVGATSMARGPERYDEPEKHPPAPSVPPRQTHVDDHDAFDDQHSIEEVVQQPYEDEALYVNEPATEVVIEPVTATPAYEPSFDDQLSGDDTDYSDFTVSAVADFLSMRGAKPIVLVVSPSGEDGSALTVSLARHLAHNGRPIILVDMTVNGAPSRLMTKEEGLPGIMDLLVGDAAFGDAIHGDRASTAHIVPHGFVKPKGPVKVYDRLSMVVGALSDAYETVLIECGAAQIESVSRILKHVSAEVILSVPNGDPEEIDGLIDAFKAAGQIDIMPMTAMRHAEHLEEA